jgi:nicotinamidase-related amidase
MSATEMTIPQLPDAVAVTVDPGATAVLVLDISDATVGISSVRETVEPVRKLVDRARRAGARVIFSLGRAAEQKVTSDLDARPDDGVVRSSADKFFNTDLAERLEGMRYAVVVGTAANGAVVYTSFGCCARGLTVVVPEDGIASRDPFSTFVARYQLLDQPGFQNKGNEPLKAKAVTLSRTDLITFGKGV